MPRQYDEKRDLTRVSVDCPVTFREGDSAQEETGQARNLSGRGLLFIAPRELPVDSWLEVRIAPDSEVTTPLHAQVKVVRVEQQRRGDGYEIGAIIKQVLD